MEGDKVFQSFILTPPPNINGRHIFVPVFNIHQPHCHEVVRKQAGPTGVLKNLALALLLLFFKSKSFPFCFLGISIPCLDPCCLWSRVYLDLQLNCLGRERRMWSRAHLRRFLASTLQWPLSAASCHPSLRPDRSTLPLLSSDSPICSPLCLVISAHLLSAPSIFSSSIFLFSLPPPT